MFTMVKAANFFDVLLRQNVADTKFIRRSRLRILRFGWRQSMKGIFPSASARPLFYTQLCSKRNFSKLSNPEYHANVPQHTPMKVIYLPRDRKTSARSPIGSRRRDRARNPLVTRSVFHCARNRGSFTDGSLTSRAARGGSRQDEFTKNRGCEAQTKID